MNMALWIAAALLAADFLLAGATHAFRSLKMLANDRRTQWVADLPAAVVRFIGVSELLGAAGLLLPALTGMLPWLTALAAVGAGRRDAMRPRLPHRAPRIHGRACRDGPAGPGSLPSLWARSASPLLLISVQEADTALDWVVLVRRVTGLVRCQQQAASIRRNGWQSGRGTSLLYTRGRHAAHLPITLIGGRNLENPLAQA